MNDEQWINKAIKQIDDLEQEKVFVLKDLFVGTEWKELGKGDKLRLGKVFKSKVSDNSIPGVVVIDSPKGTATTYKKSVKRG